MKLQGEIKEHCRFVSRSEYIHTHIVHMVWADAHCRPLTSIAKLFYGQWNYGYWRTEDLFTGNAVTNSGRLTIFEHESHFKFSWLLLECEPVCVWLNCQVSDISFQDDFILAGRTISIKKIEYSATLDTYRICIENSRTIL